MNREFLDFVEDMLDGMNKAEALLEGVSYLSFAQTSGAVLPPK
jgi:hypothetical protein